MDDDLVWLKQQLQNISHSPVSRSTLNNLEANISEAKVAIHTGNRCFPEKIHCPGEYLLFQIMQQHFSKFKVLLI